MVNFVAGRQMSNDLCETKEATKLWKIEATVVAASECKSIYTDADECKSPNGVCPRCGRVGFLKAP